jgi:hypothetical protein
MDLPLEIIEGEYAVLQLHPRSWSRLKIQVNTGKVFVTESRLIRRYHVSPEGIQKLMADCRLTSNTISGAPGRNQLVFVQDSSVSSACWRLPNRSLHSIPMDARTFTKTLKFSHKSVISGRSFTSQAAPRPLHVCQH